MAADNPITVLAGQIVLLAQQVEGAKSDASKASAGLSALRKDVAEQISGLDSSIAATADWSAEIGQLQEAIDELKEQIARLTAERELEVWDWTTMDADAAADAWSALQAWVEDIADHQLGLVDWSRRKSRANRESGEKVAHIPPCWRQHRDVVYLLAPLCQEWIKTFRTSYGTPSKALDWSARHVPGVLARISASSAHGCTHWCQGAHGWEGEGSVINQVAADDVRADARVQAEHEDQVKAERDTLGSGRRSSAPPVDAPTTVPQRQSSWSPTPTQSPNRR